MLPGDNDDNLPEWIIDDIDHINVKSNFDTENNWSIIGQNSENGEVTDNFEKTFQVFAKFELVSL